MDTTKRKQLLDRYKAQATLGGVLCIRCRGNGRVWLKSTPNLSGQKNRFDFAVNTNSAPEPGMRADWALYGAGAFTFHALETLERKETQTDAEYQDDLDFLLQIWQEKIQSMTYDEGAGQWINR